MVYCYRYQWKSKASLFIAFMTHAVRPTSKKAIRLQTHSTLTAIVFAVG